MFHAGPVIPSMIFAAQAGPGGEPKPIIIGYAVATTRLQHTIIMTTV